MFAKSVAIHPSFCVVISCCPQYPFPLMAVSMTSNGLWLRSIRSVSSLQTALVWYELRRNASNRTNLLQMFALDKRQSGLEELKDVLYRHYSKRMEERLDALWESGALDQKRLDEINGMKDSVHRDYCRASASAGCSLPALPQNGRHFAAK